MILPQSANAVLYCMIFAMLCWGSWANTLKLAGKHRFELYYFDFAFSAFLTAVICAFTLGNLGFDGFMFRDDLMHAGKREWLWALLAGAVFNLANMLLAAAVSVGGMAVAFPISAGLAIVIGVVASYLVQPVGGSMLMLAGCAVLISAVVADALAYRGRALIRHEGLAKAGKTKSLRRPAPVKAVALAAASGLVMAGFPPLIAKATQPDVGLGPYSLAVVLAIGLTFSAFVFNLFFMNLPVEGVPLEPLDYFQGGLKPHLLGGLGGMIWCAGAVAGFVAAEAAGQLRAQPSGGYALEQGYALIAALWGALIWKEFRDTDARVKALATLTLAMFALGLGMIAAAPLLAQS